MTTTLDNSQSTISNNVTQEIAEEHDKSDTVFKRVNNTARNKIEKSNNIIKANNSLQNSSSKSKILNESYCSPYNGNYIQMISRVHYKYL